VGFFKFRHFPRTHKDSDEIFMHLLSSTKLLSISCTFSGFCFPECFGDEMIIDFASVE